VRGHVRAFKAATCRRTPRRFAPEFVSICKIRVKNPSLPSRSSRAILETMNEPGKFLVIAGLLLVAVGALLWSGLGKDWLGRLPGDINYTKGDFSFHFPIMTCLILSALLTLILWLFRK
jgi:hypothetical protein